VTRSPTVTSAIALTGNGTFGVLTLSLTPAFLPTIFAYAATVPYKVSSVFAAATFSLGTMQFNLSTAATAIQTSLTSTVQSTSTAPLAVGPNTILLIQSADGQSHDTMRASKRQRETARARAKARARARAIAPPAGRRTR
jgi:hypothetical protein